MKSGVTHGAQSWCVCGNHTLPGLTPRVECRVGYISTSDVQVTHADCPTGTGKRPIPQREKRPGICRGTVELVCYGGRVRLGDLIFTATKERENFVRLQVVLRLRNDGEMHREAGFV